MKIAERQNAAVQRAREMLGPAKAYGKWLLKDLTGQQPDREVYCCRREGQVGWQPSAEEAFGNELLYERRTDKYIEVKGVRHYYMRWQLWCGAMEEYHPMAPDALRKRNETRKANKAAKELARDKAAMPLFKDQLENANA